MLDLRLGSRGRPGACAGGCQYRRPAGYPAGATAVYEDNVLQRYFQDIHVITQHMQSRLAHYELVGQYWLGLPIDENRL